MINEDQKERFPALRRIGVVREQQGLLGAGAGAAGALLPELAVPMGLAASGAGAFEWARINLLERILGNAVESNQSGPLEVSEIEDLVLRVLRGTRDAESEEKVALLARALVGSSSRAGANHRDLAQLIRVVGELTTRDVRVLQKVGKQPRLGRSQTISASTIRWQRCNASTRAAWSTEQTTPAVR